MHAEGISFRHAIQMLQEGHLPTASATARAVDPPQKSTVKKLPVLIERDASDRQLLQVVAGYYTETLRKSPEAMKYLETRGLMHSQMIEQFRLGFANRTLGYHLPFSNRVTGAELRGRLQKLGIYRESGHEHFSGSLLIPILNLNHEVVQMCWSVISVISSTRGRRTGSR